MRGDQTYPAGRDDDDRSLRSQLTHYLPRRFSTLIILQTWLTCWQQLRSGGRQTAGWSPYPGRPLTHKRAASASASVGPGLQTTIYLAGREPVTRMSTSLRALCCQPGPDATWATPIRARSRSKGSRSRRMSPLLMARFTSASMAPPIIA